MNKEFNLSEKICEVKIKDNKDEYWREVFFEEDVKEFVKRLKERINKWEWKDKGERDVLLFIIDKLAGEKLK